MSVRAAARGGPVGKVFAVVAGLALTAAGVSGCGQGAAHGAGSSAARSVRDALTASVVLDSGGHAWQPATAGVLVSTDAGRTWATVRLPGQPAVGHSVVVAGQMIAAVTVTARGGLAYQRSTNGGASWHSIAMPASTPTNQASIALSGNGKQVAVMAVLPNSAGAGGLPELAVGPVAGPLRPVSAPVSGYIAWAGATLIITGGPLQSRLYTSGNGGASWTARPADGAVAPRFNVPPDAPSFGVPMPGPGPAVTVPVTEHRGATGVVQLLRSQDGTHYVPGPRVTLPGVIGAGVTALVSPAGPGRYVIAAPGGSRLQFVGAGGDSAITPAGMAGAIESLTFSSARDGLAETTQSSCAGKGHCRSTVTLYRTSDGGRHWTPAGP